MDWTKRRERFRAQIAAAQCVYPGSVFDPVSARIAEDLGYEVGMFAGSIASLTVLGAPDHIVLTLSEFAAQSYRICRAGELPLLVDADHGYGNALNVMRTIEELESAGVAALSIEDTELPRPYALGDKARLISRAEAVGKMRAALAARQDSRLVIAGRTSAGALTSVKDCIERCQSYEDVGVDMTFLVGLRSIGDLETIAASLQAPIILGGASSEMLDRDYLGQLGVRIALQTHKPALAAIRAAYDTLRALREGQNADTLEYVVDAALLRQLTRAEQYDSTINTYLQPGDTS
ncbi:MAG: isocitrate lyase/phosphoenolpyruvate mutase family protein [Pseudomonadota bacterium]|jgi:carboxyvinyl-carboxyphosphonate phosphorylmutase|nr:isocitrate lyase/phosphoenolpyruvate mutase family protein [Pseudomonadota bacterium]